MNQLTFLKGKLSSDNFIVAHEMAHFTDTHTKGKSIYAALKMDLPKAYDRIE